MDRAERAAVVTMLAESNLSVPTTQRTFRNMTDRECMMKLFRLKMEMQNSHIPVRAFEHSELQWISIGYFSLFLIGISGNISTLTILIETFRTSHRAIRPHEKTNKVTIAYLVGLTLLDMCVLLTIPLLATDIYLGHWLFGNEACKLFLTAESIGKVVSTFVLSAMSYTRYVTVCRPSSRIRAATACQAVFVVLVLLSIAIGLLFPFTYFAEVIRVRTKHHFLAVPVDRCSLSGMPHSLQIATTVYCFFLGYFIPTLIIAGSNIGLLLSSKVNHAFLECCLTSYFGAKRMRNNFLKIRVPGLLRRVQHHKQSIRSVRSTIPTRRIVWYTVAISVFYFGCWTPHWAAILYSHFFKVIPDIKQSHQLSEKVYVYAMYGIHALPYISSSFNWFFYALLNKQLQRAKARSVHGAGGEEQYLLGSRRDTYNLSPKRICTDIEEEGGQIFTAGTDGNGVSTCVMRDRNSSFNGPTNV